MKNQKDIDDLIKQALSEEDAEVLRRIDDQGIIDLMTSSFQGKLKWIAMFSAVIMVILFVVSVYCLFHFINTTDLREMMLWGAGMGMSMMSVGLLKTWHWMQMDKNALIREIKRLELQISLLIKK